MYCYHAKYVCTLYNTVGALGYYFKNYADNIGSVSK